MELREPMPSLYSYLIVSPIDPIMLLLLLDIYPISPGPYASFNGVSRPRMSIETQQNNRHHV